MHACNSDHHHGSIPESQVIFSAIPYVCGEVEVISTEKFVTTEYLPGKNKKVKKFCNVYFCLIMSKRINIFGICVHLYLARSSCPSDCFLVDCNLISWINDHGKKPRLAKKWSILVLTMPVVNTWKYWHLKTQIFISYSLNMHFLM